MLNADLSKRCQELIKNYFGTAGVESAKQRPVTWVRYEANPQLKTLRRKHKHLPLIAIKGGEHRIYLELSTEAGRKNRN